jgi:hypothetical protein
VTSGVIEHGKALDKDEKEKIQEWISADTKQKSKSATVEEESLKLVDEMLAAPPLAPPTSFLDSHKKKVLDTITETIEGPSAPFDVWRKQVYECLSRGVNVPNPPPGIGLETGVGLEKAVSTINLMKEWVRNGLPYEGAQPVSAEKPNPRPWADRTDLPTTWLLASGEEVPNPFSGMADTHLYNSILFCERKGWAQSGWGLALYAERERRELKEASKARSAQILNEEKEATVPLPDAAKSISVIQPIPDPSSEPGPHLWGHRTDLPKEWISATGSIRICGMKDGHIANAIHYLEKKGKKGSDHWLALWEEKYNRGVATAIRAANRAKTRKLLEQRVAEGVPIFESIFSRMDQELYGSRSK